MVFAMLTRRLPHADGPFDYMRVTFGDGFAFATMWCYWTSLQRYPAWLVKLVAGLPLVDAVTVTPARGRGS